MSEYQFVHFIAIDRPLDDEQLAFMKRQSTRATVTRREFTNEYHFGEFHGKTLQMMRRGFDLHVHFANYGIRTLMFRLPDGFPGGMELLQPYLIEDTLEWDHDKDGPGGVLTIHPEYDGGNWNGYYHQLEDLLTELTPVREMLIRGDLRPLYVAWLACAPFESPEPPVPAGLHSLPESLQKLADFYEISPDLLHVAAKESVQLTQRTREDLFRKAREHGVIRERQENDAKEKLRKTRLADMAKNPGQTVAAVSKLVAMRSIGKYSEAVALLCDLREALGPDIGPEFTSSVAAELRVAFPRTNGLISKLKESGFLKR